MGMIYTHPGQPQMQVEVILASRPAPTKRGLLLLNSVAPIWTVRARYPRAIHAEVKTHRVKSMDSVMVGDMTPGLDIMGDKNLSRNARSSRAVPVKTMLNEVRTMPYVPWHWGANQKGMQAGAECDETVVVPALYKNHADTLQGYDRPFTREEAWLHARDAAVLVAEGFMNAGYHKQNPNRLLEPFAWIDTLFTSTDWANFLWLREHEAAEPHLQDLARLVHKALDEHTDIQTLQPGWWHLPYITEADWDVAVDMCGTQGEVIELLRKISAARCARISYAPFDGDASFERELERYDSLVSSDRVHASPTEHQAMPDRMDPYTNGFESAKLAGNLGPGWIQYRKLIPGEVHRG